VDPLRRDDIEQARRATPEERATQALQMMRAGFRLKRSALRARYPDESDDEIDARFRLWLAATDREP
jgi:Rv0078B-related antitoxin